MVYFKMIGYSLYRKTKDLKMLVILFLFPLVLTSIFAVVFEKAFNTPNYEVTLGISVEVGMELVGEGYIDFLDTMIQEGQGISYERLQESEEAEWLKNKKSDIHVAIEEDGITIQDLKNNSIAAEVVRSFSQQYLEVLSTIETIQNDDSSKLDVLGRDTSSLVIVQESKDGTSQDMVVGLVVTMLIFAGLMGGQYGVQQVHYMKEPVGKRIHTAPVPRLSIFVCEWASCWVMSFVSTSVMAIAFEVLFDIGFGKNIGAMIFLITTLTWMATLLGTLIGLIVKSSSMGDNVYAMLMTAMVLVGGRMMPQVDFGKLSYLSPVHVIYEGLNTVVVKGSIENTGTIVVVVGILSIIVLGVYTAMMRKGEDR